MEKGGKIEIKVFPPIGERIMLRMKKKGKTIISINS